MGRLRFFRPWVMTWDGDVWIGIGLLCLYIYGLAHAVRALWALGAIWSILLAIVCAGFLVGGICGLLFNAAVLRFRYRWRRHGT